MEEEGNMLSNITQPELIAMIGLRVDDEENNNIPPKLTVDFTYDNDDELAVFTIYQKFPIKIQIKVDDISRELIFSLRKNAILGAVVKRIKKFDASILYYYYNVRCKDHELGFSDLMMVENTVECAVTLINVLMMNQDIDYSDPKYSKVVLSRSLAVVYSILETLSDVKREEVFTEVLRYFFTYNINEIGAYRGKIYIRNITINHATIYSPKSSPFNTLFVIFDQYQIELISAMNKVAVPELASQSIPIENVSFVVHVEEDNINQNAKKLYDDFIANIIVFRYSEYVPNSLLTGDNNEYIEWIGIALQHPEVRNMLRINKLKGLNDLETQYNELL